MHVVTAGHVIDFKSSSLCPEFAGRVTAPVVRGMGL